MACLHHYFTSAELSECESKFVAGEPKSSPTKFIPASKEQTPITQMLSVLTAQPANIQEKDILHPNI